MSNPKTFVYKLLTSLGYKVTILDEEGEEYKSLPEDFGEEVIQDISAIEQNKAE